MRVDKELRDCLFLLKEIVVVLILLQLIFTEDARVKIGNFNFEFDGRNFYNQPINDLIKQYDEVRKVSTGQGDGYTTGCFLDFAYFKNKFRLIAADLSKQKVLDADSRAIQQIIFIGTANAGVMIYYILEQSKETILQFYKGTTKVL